MEYNYCRRCGTKLVANGEIFKCSNGHLTFQNPSPTVGVFFIRNGNIVLGRRGINPNKGMLDTVGGFVDANENFENALIREIEEETGLKENQYGKLDYLCSAPAPYEYQSEIKQVLSVFFVADLNEDAALVANDDIESFEEIKYSDLDPKDFGGEDVKIALEILKTRLVNS